MTGKWNQFSASIQRLHADFDFPLCPLYNYTGGYDPGTGQTGWTRSKAADIPTEIHEPSMSQATTGPEGQSAEVDASIHLPAEPTDTPHEYLVDVGESEQVVKVIPVGVDDTKPTEIEDSRTSVVYVVTECYPEDNGLLGISAIEA